MKIACRTLAAIRYSICVFALSAAMTGHVQAAPDSFAPFPGSISAKTSEGLNDAKAPVKSASSTAVPSSGSGAVPSASSALSSPSSVLPLPGSSAAIASSAAPVVPSSGSGSPSSAQPVVSSPSLGLSPFGAPPSSGPPGAKKDDAKSLNAIEARVSDSVKEVIKNLGSMTETATLEDINVARQAVAKLEAMIDIERRLSELEKVRNDRSRGSAASAMAAAIPASALLPLPAAKPPSTPKHSGSDDAKPINVTPMSMGSSYELSRVVGSNGRYRAVIKTGEGSEKTYRAGDKLPDGSILQDITPTSAVLKRNGDKNTIRIKGVDMVFNGR